MRAACMRGVTTGASAAGGGWTVTGEVGWSGVVEQADNSRAAAAAAKAGRVMRVEREVPYASA
ncbi:hypothetical protein GCM10007386_39050 [Pseudoduganella dura]|nr:hypothetical protein GCM10007386_39050 [Pseudoduganella dura]